mmetsp:Transcript_41175/g.57293  ORF Transcript_41175/g.57293 Transcript_41175/m.57293 type:complete len:97 (+) Transcript_41175:1-291(+)
MDYRQWRNWLGDRYRQSIGELPRGYTTLHTPDHSPSPSSSSPSSSSRFSSSPSPSSPSPSPLSPSPLSPLSPLLSLFPKTRDGTANHPGKLKCKSI